VGRLHDAPRTKIRSRRRLLLPQCIVTDADRADSFQFVRGALNRLAATSSPPPATRRSRLWRFHFDPATGIVLDGDLPCRRHVTADALVRELAAAGFAVEWHRTAPDGDIALIARLA
jgi:hypothetical protein